MGMDIEYLADRVCDELESAKDYIKQAIEIKPMKEEWSAQLVQASAQELHHAEMFKNMLDDYYKIQHDLYKDKLPAYISECYEEVAGKYGTMRAEVLMLHGVFAK